MKKLLFLVVFTLFGLQMKAADQFDELNLRGGWELVSYTGNYDLFTTQEAFWDCTPAISECKYLYLGEMTLTPEENIKVNLPGVNNTVVLDYASSLNGIVYKPEVGDDEENDDFWIGITDFSISNGNKLHLLFNPGAIHFVIESLTANELKIKSYDGNLTANYKRVTNSSKVKELTSPASSKEEIYDLNGLKAASATDGVKIVRQGEKVTKEIR